MNKKTEDNHTIEDDRNKEKHILEEKVKTTQSNEGAKEDNQKFRNKQKMTFIKPPTRIGVRERIRGAITKKNGKIWEKFPKGGGG